MTPEPAYHVTSIDEHGARDVFVTGDRSLAEAWAAMRRADCPAAVALAREVEPAAHVETQREVI